MNNCDIAKAITKIEIEKMISNWGIERTEEKIKHLYRSMPYFKLYLLREYNNILKERLK